MAKELFSRKKNEEAEKNNEALHEKNKAEDVDEIEMEAPTDSAGENEVVISAEEYRRLKELEKGMNKKTVKNAEVKPEKDIENTSQDNNSSIISQWERDAAQLKFIYPEFDFRTELQNNPQFRHLISSGMGVFEAYASSRPEQTKAEPPKQTGRKPIQQNAQSPDGGTGTNTRNPAKMSSAEFKQYIENIRNS